ncbi:uncharacterized protein RSE6_07270 [Rhynchosporium secalis]|uniref:Myb-like DNA-binding domain-containing protein n=1 Tax=Rhynchosporium secalis TaxID=38038 RepID=A0A1E1MCE0_RHYSE|nr:uncharacterized protein RSE6_07270 [Rhynchosporium secalis]
MTSESAFMTAVLRQLLVTQLDFQRLSDDTDLSSAEAARSRWRRMKVKLETPDSAGNSAVKATATAPSLQELPAKKCGKKRRESVTKLNEGEGDGSNVEGRKAAPIAKRGRGRPRKVLEKPEVLAKEADSAEESS